MFFARNLQAGLVVLGQVLQGGDALAKGSLLVFGGESRAHIADHPVDDVALFHAALNVLHLNLVVQAPLCLQ